MAKNGISLAFDIGHSSIGWAVLETDPEISVKGCGTVIFRPDDCLASERRGFRSQRRHTASVRNRIANLKVLLRYLEVLNSDDLNLNPISWPWILAAEALQGNRILSWQELWSVLRWYAHNRGYDANKLWSKNREEDESEDIKKKVKQANELMSKFKTESMAETVCTFLETDKTGKKASRKYFKGQNAAFPRDVVKEEVTRILKLHIAKLPQVDARFIDALCEDWKSISCPEIKLKRHFTGGLLFGQHVPRFNNRIIPSCRKTAEKTPLKHCREFYHYRWARLLNNLRVGGRILTADERKAIHKKIELTGYFNKTWLRNALEESTGEDSSQVEDLILTDEMEEALIFDPARAAVVKAFDPRRKLIPDRLLEKVWTHIPKRCLGKLFKEEETTLGQIREIVEESNGDLQAFDDSISSLYDGIKERLKDKKTGLEEIFSKSIRVKKISGRAPYCRKILVRTFEEVLEGKDPTGEHGCLYETEEDIERLDKTPLERLTNNHLVRHRLLIFERLLKNILKNYAGGNPRCVKQATIETIRDFQEFSGLTSKEKVGLLSLKLSHHKKVSEKLEEELIKIGRGDLINGTLIRKARVADELGWTCPYTGAKYGVIDLLDDGRMQIEHIIPYSQRPTNSLESVVMTFRAVNDMKGNRTALRFIEKEGGKEVPGMPNLFIITPQQYTKFTSKLKPHGSSKDDKRRCQNRKDLLQTRDYNPRQGKFTGRDLTITSFIDKLAAAQLRKFFDREKHWVNIVHLPGAVTGYVRKSWNVLGCLGQACPQTLDLDGEPKTKTKIREITHLHHALDAITEGLAAILIPPKTRIWELMAKRNLTEEEKSELSTTGTFSFNAEDTWQLKPLCSRIKNQISSRLAEKRVIMHLPSSMKGLKVEQNTWRVRGENPQGKVEIEQYKSRDKQGVRKKEQSEENPAKLLGYVDDDRISKLKNLKGSLIIKDNYGVALDPDPTVIPHFKVYTKIKQLKERNNGKWAKILRKGMIIKITRGRYEGIWRVKSIKANSRVGILIDITRPEFVNNIKIDGCFKENVLVKTLKKDGLKIVKQNYVAD